MPKIQAINSMSVHTGEARWEVQAFMLYCGRDIHVTFAGGQKPHIGAVALAVPRASLEDPTKLSASASVLCVTGHKEDQLARDTALELAIVSESVATVTVGLHIDQANVSDLEKLLENFNQAVSKIVALIKQKKS